MLRKSLLLTLVFLLAMGSFAWASTRPLPNDAAPESKQVLRIPMLFEGQYMDWMKTVYNRAGRPEVVQEPLTVFDKDMNVRPAAAAKWQPSEDGLCWTFTLRAGIKWSDGQPLTAEDFVFALERAIQQGYDFNWYFSWAAEIVNWDQVEAGELPFSELGVKALDARTIEVKTETPKPYLPAVMSWWFPVPKHVVQAHGDEYATRAETMVCSGPFMVKEWVKEQHVVYVPNPHYNGPWQPYLREIVELAGTGNPETGFPAYLAGDLDITGLNPGQLAYAKARFSEEVVGWPEFQLFYLTFDTTKPPFDSKLVRQAINHAIDRELLTNTVLADMAFPAYTLIMPGFPGYNAGLKEISRFDIDLARELLAEAGYPNGKGFPEIELWLRLEASIMPHQKPAAEFIQQQLKQNLGINMKIQIYEMKTFMDAMVNRTHNFFLAPYMVDYVDPSNFMSLFLSGGRHAWAHNHYDDLVKEANSIIDHEQRLRLYEEAEALLLEEAPAVFIMNMKTNHLWKPHLGGEAVTEDSSGLKRLTAVTNLYFFSNVYITQ
ncbi:MAG: peptide ABC transporter substrate-binding protein [Firmicutes bacterium]|nr:peptide ABC transporter substrate-binding protein [Bacillota bacterium]